MKLLALLCFWVFLSASAAFSQTAVVTRNVNLRPDASTEHKPIVTLAPPAEVKLLETNLTNGFYHVKAGPNEGWVWGRNIKVQPAASSQPASAGGALGMIEPARVSEISSSWPKGTPENKVLHDSEGDCSISGDGGDTATNLLKNRSDVPSAYHYVSWDAINNLGYPHGAKKERSGWTQSQLDQIAPFEGVPIAVEGFLYKVKVESSSPSSKGGESTNCHAHLANNVDWHMPVTAQKGQGEDVAVVVETTPRIRQLHPNWTVARLKPWTENIGTHTNSSFNGQPVRIRGWLMFDPEHQDMINNGLRSTLWEIHPITQIEVFQGGQWVDLDSLP